MRFNTKAVHGDHQPDKSTGALMVPIYQTSTFLQPSLLTHGEYCYSRTANPTRSALEKAIAALEYGRYGLAFGSGLAAVDAVIKLLSPGDEVITGRELYGGTYRLFKNIWERYQIKFHFANLDDLSEISSLINPNTKMIWAESPTNPLLHIVDINALGLIAKKYQLIFVVDNTFASPYLQNPIQLGADVVVHSATKYLGGHSDVVLGCVVVNDEELAKKLYFIQNAGGAICGPMDSFLVLRGLKTLHVRMQRHCENASKIAAFLRGHQKVDRVYWPGFEDHPNHKIAKAQMKDFGGMITFTLAVNNLQNTSEVIQKLRIFTLAESLGGVESLCGHPASMTHASLSEDERISIGIVPSMIRLSVGIEDAEDLIADLENALG
jgi:cystathionine beta-lyase/cystathionine gamma-synthase